MQRRILVDTGYWIALLNERDKHHAAAQTMESNLTLGHLFVPWPTLYECVNTRISRRRDAVARFRQFMHRPNTEFVDDAPYRHDSLDCVLDAPYRRLSLSDHVIRSMLEDVDLSFDAFIGFNVDDFYDVCAARGVEMLDGN